MIIWEKDGSDLDYLVPKLREMRRDGEALISALVKDHRRSKTNVFELDPHQELRRTIQATYRTTLERMSRLIIDLGWASESNAVNSLLGVASGMAFTIMEDHRKWLFRLPTSADLAEWHLNIERYDASFDETVKSVAFDLQRGIVGNVRHTKGGATTMIINRVDNSPNSTIQQGRDDLQQSAQVSGNFSAFADALENISKRLTELSLAPADADQARNKIAAMQAELKTTTPDKSYLQRGAEFVGDLLSKAAGGVASALAGELVKNAHLL
jgi:hypothetical protein